MRCDPVLRAGIIGIAVGFMFAGLFVAMYWFGTGMEIPR
jgi:hypothetical protein